MNQVILSAKRFRVLENLNWSPDGLCLLVGANGSGKTTTLDLLGFLRNFFERGQENALLSIDGGHIRTRGLTDDEPVELELAVGEIRWRLRLPLSASGFTGTYGETLLRGDETILHAEMFADHWLLGRERIPREGPRCAAALYWDRYDPESKWMHPLVSALASIRVYQSFYLNQVQHPDSRDRPMHFLHGQAIIFGITSHSPVVMNAFRRHPEQFYVFEPGAARMPVALTELHDEDWLSAFMSGDLYDRLEFAAPATLHAGDD